MNLLRTYPLRAPIPSPAPTAAPAAKDLDESDKKRIVRIETRLVRLMAHLGLDAEGFPLEKTR